VPIDIKFKYKLLKYNIYIYIRFIYVYLYNIEVRHLIEYNIYNLIDDHIQRSDKTLTFLIRNILITSNIL